MGAKFCIMLHPKTERKPGSLARGNSNAGSSFMDFIKPRCLKNRRMSKVNDVKNFKEKTLPELPEKKIAQARKLTLEDWLLSSPSYKPEYLKRGESELKHSKKRVHPSSSQNRGSLISEVRDSVTLDRPMNHHQEGDGKSESLSSVSRSSSRKSQKRVTFELPHIVIFYSPDKPHCSEPTLQSPEEPYYNSDDSFYSPLETDCRGDTMNSSDVPCSRLAVDTFPHVSVSSSM